MDNRLKQYLIDNFSIKNMQDHLFIKNNVVLDKFDNKTIAYIIIPSTFGTFKHLNLILAYEIVDNKTYFQSTEIGHIDYCISKNNNKSFFDKHDYKTHLLKIFVDKNYRHIGVGSKLLKALHKRIKSVCIGKTLIYGEYSPENDSKEFAQNFYQKNGFKIKKYGENRLNLYKKINSNKVIKDNIEINY